LSATIFSFIKKRISSVAGKKTLYYPGCMTLHCQSTFFNNYKSLLSDVGISFIVIDELTCCGSPLLNAGYASDFEELKKNNLEILRKNQVSKIITNCPHCYVVFKKQYGFEVEHITQTLADHSQKITFKNKEEASYHDPCILAKQHIIINEPRKLLKQTGLKLIEPVRTKNKTFCCGAGSGVKQNYPELANKMAKERLSQFGSNKIITSCPYCYAHLQENADNKKKIIELSEALTGH